MEREYIRKVLEDYADYRMDTAYSPDKEETEAHEFSKKHEKKMKKLIWSEKYFGTHITLGNVVRRVAVFAAVILSLAAANTVSAKVFGFNPWKTFVTKIGAEWETVTYRGTENQRANYKKRLHEAPSYVPEGYQATYSEETEVSSNVAWEQGESKVAYSSIQIEDGMVRQFSQELVKKEDLIIGGYAAVLYEIEGEWFLMWDDGERENNLSGTGISVEELTKMAESIYEEN